MKNLLKVSNVLFLLAILLISSCANKKTTEDEGWIQLFNGKDLNDWDIKFKGYELGVNLNNTFRVEDGKLIVSYDEWEGFNSEFGHIFYKGVFSHYKLRVEYRFVGEQVEGGAGWAIRNNGLMLHGQLAESMGLDQDFPTSVEVQLLGGDGENERTTMNLCTPGTNVEMNGELVEQHCILSNSETYHGDQWVSVEVEVIGGEVIRHFVEGVEVMHYEKPQLDPRDATYDLLLPADGNKILCKGTISLQAESGPTEFRKIELLKLGDGCDE
ncbi:MAG: DUF1080 domain-containing protein [Mariniphaga sp.]|nr:DUF1080 domain-containing protein [Mariniphaga sp.]